MHAAEGGHRIRAALPSEAPLLSALAMRAKAHWGYDREFLERVRPLLTFSAADLEAGPTFVLERAGVAVGVSRIVGAPPEGELSDLWLEPSLIGRGLGRAMLRHAVAFAAERGFASPLIKSDPFAEGFHLAMGAVRIGEAPAGSGRNLPLLRIAVTAPGSARASH